MKFVLLALFPIQTYLGTYGSEQACQNAIRERMIADTAPPSVAVMWPEVRKSAEKVVDQTIKYQTDYICVAKEQQSK